MLLTAVNLHPAKVVDTASRPSQTAQMSAAWQYGAWRASRSAVRSVAAPTLEHDALTSRPRAGRHQHAHCSCCTSCAKGSGSLRTAFVTCCAHVRILLQSFELLPRCSRI